MVSHTKKPKNDVSTDCGNVDLKLGHIDKIYDSK